MKFSEHLWNNLTPEWYSQYIDYDGMKEFLIDAINKSHVLYRVDQIDERTVFLENVDHEFLQLCLKELNKIEHFYSTKTSECQRRFDLFQNQLELLIAANGSNESATKNQKGKSARLLNDFKSALSELYLMVFLLKNYQTLNSTGFRKIVKKHDKMFETTRATVWKEANVDRSNFVLSKETDRLMENIETIYTKHFESGNRRRAMERLRVPSLDQKQSKFVTFRVGFLLGIIAVLCPLIIVLGFVLNKNQDGQEILWRRSLRLYRSFFIIYLDICLISLNLYGWSHYGVNHVLIFEFDPRNHLSYQKLLEFGLFFIVILLINYLSFIITFYYNLSSFVNPLVLFVFSWMFLLNPTRTFYYRSRVWLMRKLVDIFLSPLKRVDFSSFWLADQLISMEIVFADIEYIICFYLTRSNLNLSSEDEYHTKCQHHLLALVIQSILIVLPSWFRFAQCLRRYRDSRDKHPHLTNAGKYATGFLVVLTNFLRRLVDHRYSSRKQSNPFVYLWFLSLFISSTYKLIWDFKMDWGFFDRTQTDNRFLRRQLIYPSTTVYYLVLIVNFIFRYIWIINFVIIFHPKLLTYSDLFGFSFALVEVFRRFIWNFFRLENEHLNNCGQFRAVRDLYPKLVALDRPENHLEKLNKLNLNQEYLRAKEIHGKVVRRRSTVSPMNLEQDQLSIVSNT